MSAITFSANLQAFWNSPKGGVNGIDRAALGHLLVKTPGMFTQKNMEAIDALDCCGYDHLLSTNLCLLLHVMTHMGLLNQPNFDAVMAYPDLTKLAGGLLFLPVMPLTADNHINFDAILISKVPEELAWALDSLKHLSGVEAERCFAAVRTSEDPEALAAAFLRLKSEGEITENDVAQLSASQNPEALSKTIVTEKWRARLDPDILEKLATSTEPEALEEILEVFYRGSILNLDNINAAVYAVLGEERPLIIGALQCLLRANLLIQSNFEAFIGSEPLDVFAVAIQQLNHGAPCPTLDGECDNTIVLIQENFDAVRESPTPRSLSRALYAKWRGELSLRAMRV